MKVTTYKGEPFATTENLYRVIADPELQQNDGPLLCPPAVVPLFERPIAVASTVRTPMDKYGWDDYLKKLNGDKYEVAIDYHLAMFNGEPGNLQMESLIFMCDWVYAVPDTWGWHRVLTLNYYDGPPEGMPTYYENPIFVQKFTAICKMGAVLARNLYYPVVCRYKVYIPSKALEPYAKIMETQPPPAGMTAKKEMELGYV